MVKPRLETLLKSHESLWAIRLLAAGELRDDEKRMVKESFELQFLMPHGEQTQRRLLHMDQVVQKQLHKIHGGITVDTEQYHAEVRAASVMLHEAAPGARASRNAFLPLLTRSSKYSKTKLESCSSGGFWA